MTHQRYSFSWLLVCRSVSIALALQHNIGHLVKQMAKHLMYALIKR